MDTSNHTTELCTNEEWRDIPGYEGFYQVSNLGRIKRIAGSPKCCKERFLKPSQKNSYFGVSLSKGADVKQIDIHRLMAWAFIGEQGDLWVNHKNGNKLDNRIENLEYMTPGGNVQHAYDTGLMPSRKGEGNPGARATEQMVREIRRLAKQGVSRDTIREQFGLSRTAIQNIITRLTWSHIE